MSAVLITTGCAGPSGAATASRATSQTQSSASSGQADSSAQADDAGLSDQAASADNKDASGNPEGRSSSGKKSKDSASAETPAELRTVDPSAYAGQTVDGKVTAISGSQVTVTLGTFKEKSNKNSSDSGTSDSDVSTSNTEGATASGSNTSVPSTSAAPAGGNTGMAEANREKTGKGKKSSFKSSGEQMTVTIPETLSDIEIKENYVLSITLDESGNVTAVEVKSKGRSRSDGIKPDEGQMPEGGIKPGEGQTPEGGSNSENCCCSIRLAENRSA